MNRHCYLRRFAALLILSATLALSATPVDRESPKDPILGLGDRIVRIIKKLPKPTLPKIFDDIPSIPKP